MEHHMTGWDANCKCGQLLVSTTSSYAAAHVHLD